MLDALPLANEARPGDRLLTGTDAAHDRVAAIDLATQRLEALDRLGLQSAIGQFLDAVGETGFRESAGCRAAARLSNSSRHIAASNLA